MINYEMVLSEIKMYRKAHESLCEDLKHANSIAERMKAERDTLIDDLSWYKAKVKRLEQIREMKESAFKGASNKIKRLEHRNKDLSVQFNEYIDETYEYLKLLSEFSEHIGNKPSSSTYKYFREKLDGIGIKEGE